MSKLISGNISGKRHRLSEVVPLGTPYSVGIFPVYACNFRCRYCEYSLPRHKRNEYYRNLNVTQMDFGLFMKVVDDMKDFPEKFKAMDIAGLGEPLLYPKISDMVRYAKESGSVECVSIFTNGSMLTPEVSDKLIDAGLDRLRISLQGLNTGDYKKMSSVSIDFESLLENIQYFYEHRGGTKVYIKIIDIALGERTDDFIKLFSSMADDLAIEHLSPMFREVDYGELGNAPTHTLHGDLRQKLTVCPQPFYRLAVSINGDVTCCCAVDDAVMIGSVSDESLKDMWNGEKVKNIRMMQLEGQKDRLKVCRDCEFYTSLACPEDDLDDVREELLRRLSR